MTIPINQGFERARQQSWQVFASCSSLTFEAGSEFGSGLALSVADGDTPGRFGGLGEQFVEPRHLVVGAEVTVRLAGGH